MCNGQSSTVLFDILAEEWLRWVTMRVVGGPFSCVFIYNIVCCRGIVMTYQEHFGVTYIILNEDPSPRMLIHNKCPIPLLLKETVKGEG